MSVTWSSLKDKLWESDVPKVKPNVQPILPVLSNVPPEPSVGLTPNPTVYPDYSSTAFQVQADAIGSNKSYQHLKEKINFDKTKAYEILEKYLGPLRNVAVDERTKYIMAIAQIRQIEQIDPTQLLATFDGMKVSLGAEQDNFNNFIDQQQRETVDPLANRMTSLTQELSDLQDKIQTKSFELTKVNADKAEAEAKLNKAKGEFALAVQFMSNDIERDRQKYTALLQA